MNRLLHACVQQAHVQRGQDGPWLRDTYVFQVAGMISAGIVMIAIVALGKLLEPLQKV